MKTTTKAAGAARTTAAVKADIAALDDAAGPRAALLAKLETGRPALVDAGDVDGIEALDARIRRARIEGEVDDARRAKLVAEHAGLEAAEQYAADQAVRRDAHAAAIEAAEEGRRLFREEYPRLAREMAELLARTQAIRRQVEAANDRLPDGTERIPMEFEPVRGRKEIRPTSTTFKRHVWVNKVTGEEAAAFQPGDPNYERRVREETMKSEGAPAVAHVPIHDLVSLPGVGYLDPPFWAPAQHRLAAPAGPAFSDFRQIGVTPPLGGRPRFHGGRA